MASKIILDVFARSYWFFCGFSGGLQVEVGGSNLDVVHQPKIVATVLGEEHIQYQAVSQLSPKPRQSRDSQRDLITPQ